MRSKGLAVLRLVALATTGWSSGALAQAASEPAATETSDAAIEDIVVTAQRREERLQDVPIAVSAFTTETIRSLGVRDTSDLTIAIPGLDMGRQNIAIAPFIRGVGTKNTSPGEEAAVTVYVDGVYLPTLTGGIFALSNIERVEVLKGPQGTLFGRNATAGVINIVTREPSDEPSADISLGYGNYDTIEGSFYGTSGVAPGVRADFAAYGRDQGDGWGTNLTTGNDVFKGYEYSFRSKWLFDLGESTTLQITGDIGKNKPLTPPAYRPLPGKRFIGGVPYQGFFNVAETRDVFATSRQWGGNVQLRHDFDIAEFVSITSYRNVDIYFQFDQDGTPAPLFTPTTWEDAETWTQEFQLLSPQDAPFDWIVGLYYFDDTSGYAPIRLQGIVFGPNIIDRFSTQKSKSYAGYAQVTVPLGDRTDITGGIRYTRDEREIDAQDFLNGNPGPMVAQDAAFEKLTYRASLDHRFSDSVLAYGSVSRGFKSGVYNTVAPTNAAVRPAVVDAYEIGIKTDLADNRLRFNAAAFYNDFKDIQLQVPVPGGIALLNAAKARFKGFEVEATAVPVDGLTLRGAVTVLDGEYTDFGNAPYFEELPGGGSRAFVGVATGNDTIHTPDVTFSISADYEFETTVGAFNLSASYYHNDGFWFDPQNRIRQPSYGLINAGIEYTAPSEAWGLRLWAKNLNDDRYYTNIVAQTWGDTATPAGPRTYGVTLLFNLR